MNILKIHIFLLIVSAAAFSCTERIDVRLDDSYIRLVVDGSITTDTMFHKVVLSESSGYFYNQPAAMVTGAEVSITDGESTFMLKEDSPGKYFTDPKVYGIPGRMYTLNIKLLNAVGGYKEYTASSELNAVSPLDSASLKFNPEWSTNGVWEVKCFVQDPPTSDFYRFLIMKNDRMITDTLNDWFVTDDRFFNGNYTYGATIAYLEQGSSEEGLKPGDIITVELNNIGKEYANFLWDAQSELFGSNPLFSGPPANVKGNISNGAIGFFTAYSVTRSSAKTPEFNRVSN